MQTALEIQPAETFQLTPKQLEARDLTASEAMYVLLYGGSRSAKTFLHLRTIAIRASMAPKSRHVVFRHHFTDVKGSVIADTFPKMMELCFPEVPYNLNKTDSFFTFPNGAEIWFAGLDDKDRVEKILGKEFVTIFLNECSEIPYSSYVIVLTRLAQKVFYERRRERHEMRLKLLLDENPPLQGHWTHKIFVEHKDPTTRKAIAHPHLYASMLMNPLDNAENLPAAYLRTLETLPKRQRDRFWLGLFGAENENALWSTAIIEKSKVDGADLPQFVRVVVAVDPSGAADEENDNNDAIGIIVVGLGTDGIAYVLEDLTLTAGPKAWGDVVRSAYDRHEADRVVGEVNFGGAMVEFVIKSDRADISYRSVTASRGKMLRAEPVSSLHEGGKIAFVGDFPELEDECTSCTTMGYMGAKSPNRLDSFVFAILELFPMITNPRPKAPLIVTIPNMKRI